MTLRTRFAPSPTGPLHLGHAFSAITAYELARDMHGEFLLRIEDIDQARSRPSWEAQILDDLAWLGLSWQDPVLRQSDNMVAYAVALGQLTELGVVYNCYCTRRDIQMAISAPQEGASQAMGPDGLIYPGTCRNLTSESSSSLAPAIRLNMQRALEVIDVRSGPGALCYTETGGGSPKLNRFKPEQAIQTIGDIVLARRDMGTSYHLSVVVDDAAQHITHVVRGEDLAQATQIHVILQKLLGHVSPIYHHHRLIRDENGKRLAKRDDARALSTYRAAGETPQDIRARIGL